MIASPAPLSGSVPALDGAERRRIQLSEIVLIRAGLALVLLIAAALRLSGLDQDSLWYDEIFGLTLAQQPFAVVLEVIGGFVANMALYLVLMHVWMAIIGPMASDALPRIPSVLFGVLGVWAVFQLGADLLNRRAGLAAALLLAVSPYHIGWSQDARSYTLWTLFGTLAFWTLLRALRQPNQREWWLAYVLTMSLAFYSHFFTAFIAISQGLWILSRMQRAEIVRFAMAAGVLGILLVPLALFGLSNTDGSQLRHVPLPDWRDLRLMLRSYSGSDWAQFGYAALLTLGALSLIIRPVSRSSRSTCVMLALWLLVTPVVIFTLSFVYKPMFRERYAFIVLPALCLLAGAAIARSRLVLIGGVLVALIVFLSIQTAISGFGVRRDEDWRSAVKYLTEQAQSGDGFIFISRRNHLPWQYYAPQFGKDPLAIDDIEPFDWHELARSRTYRAPAFSRADLDRFSSDHPRIWLVLSHEFDAFEERNERGDTSAWVRDRLTRTGFAARQRIFPSIRLLLYEKRR